MAKRRAFTMIELMMVVTIMGIIAALVLRASVGGIRRAEEKATIGLIAKLEAALTDRVDALQNDHPEPTGLIVGNTVVQQGHASLAAIYTSSGQVIASPARAQVIAFYDNLRAELPDVFYIAPGTSIAAVPPPGTYPINFGGVPFAAATGTGQNPAALPLGADGSNAQITGWNGASFAAAAGIYQQLGYLPAGCNGADDDNNGYIDDASEGVKGLDPQGTQLKQINDRLANHKHKTCRAEMLYAILVHGTGPMGSSYDPDDFSKNEVADTDNDGLMEFVDAWGEPLQFYRWPVLYRSDTQLGFPDLAKITQDTANKAPIGPYNSSYDAREVNTLDPNQLLLSPAWWTATYNSNTKNFIGFSGDSTSNASGGAIAFQTFFHTLIDPLAASSGTSGYSSGTPPICTYWDRSAKANTIYGSIFARRAYYNRFLVLSAGLDKIPGTARLDLNYQSYNSNGIDERTSFPLVGGGFSGTRDATGGLIQFTVANLVQIENQAGRVDPNRSGLYLAPTLSSGRNDTNTFLEDVGNDDITSQNIHALGGPLQ